MQPIPETYFSRRMRESQIAMGAATDSCSRLAHAQMEAAYRVLASVADPLVTVPRFQIGLQPGEADGTAALTIGAREIA